MSTPHLRRKTRAAGFTLIELMVVVAVVAILASIAYPSYRDAVLKGRRAQARTALLELMQQQERYMTQHNTYLNFATDRTTGITNPIDAANTFKVYAGDSGSSPPYWLSANFCVANNGQCIVLSAVPTHSDPAVGALTLSSTGVKGCPAAINKNLCWP